LARNGGFGVGILYEWVCGYTWERVGDEIRMERRKLVAE